jgi:hypothetical protein
MKVRCLFVVATVASCSKPTASPTPPTSSTALEAPAARPSASATAAPAASSALPDAGADAAASEDSFAAYDAPALLYECISRERFGYTCTNAYGAVAQKFPADAAVVQSLMRLAVRIGAGKPLGGEAEVTDYCVPEKGEGDAYSCLYLAEADSSPRGRAAHALACKKGEPEAEVPVAGGSAACAGGKPVRITALPKAEAADVKACFACGRDPAVSWSDLSDIASAKACARLEKRLRPAEAAFVERSIAGRCAKGS